MAEETYYMVLGVSEGATPAEIKTAYHALLKKIHPDTVASLSSDVRLLSKEATKELIQAYSVLSDANRRRDYDQQLINQRRRLSRAPTPPGQQAPVNLRPRYHRCGQPLNAQGRCPKCHRRSAARKERSPRRHRRRSAWLSLKDSGVVMPGLVLLGGMIIVLLIYLIKRMGASD